MNYVKYDMRLKLHFKQATDRTREESERNSVKQNLH